MANQLTWLGHSTVLIEVAGVRLLTDPVLGSQILHLRRRVPAPAVPAGVDAVLLSHQHRDHLDLPSLRRLDRGAKVLTGVGTERVLRRLEQQVMPMEAGDTQRFGDVAVRAVPAIHDNRRNHVGPQNAALGFLVDWGPRLYFAGDTELFDGLEELAPVDFALLPIWGWGPSLGEGHMDPEQAAEATARLRAHVVVPIHWGTFLPVGMYRRHGHVLRDPPVTFTDRVAELAPDTRVAVLAPGDTLEL